ncbi:hypothetical protein FOL47_008521 [Perkinsus chesapeaki]|uniref:N-acetyltransferase domain-containing protein n=1 Tax=Perkinsus chesapeaki TaxID=330153 RepID=A0A7J6MTL6_PERCH|nr:hypothetical protein FOL47_008521 [Perkinsus chesapeaki]
MRIKTSLLLLFTLVALSATEKILYRDYQKGDVFPGIFFEDDCEHKQGVPCYVAVNLEAGPHAVIGYVSAELPHKLEPKEENAVRAKMSDPKKKGHFGYIKQVEVDRAFRRRGIGLRLVSDTLVKAPTVTPYVLAVALELIFRVKERKRSMRSWDLSRFWKKKNTPTYSPTTTRKEEHLKLRV